MNCSGEWIEGYLDNELDAAGRSAATEHLAGCAACSETYAKLRQQKAQIQAEAPYYEPPPGLERSVRDALRQASSHETRERTPSVPWRPLAIAASFLLAISMGWNVSQLRNRSQQDPAGREVLSSHIRSLIGTHLLDVPTSDQHTVKPWFNGKLDFSPAVKDLAPQGFPLAGGRIDYISGKTVAAIVYHRRLHVINLFVWPTSAASTGDSQFSENGFHAVHWTDGAMTYWAVSDISLAELQQFKQLLQ